MQVTPQKLSVEFNNRPGAKGASAWDSCSTGFVLQTVMMNDARFCSFEDGKGFFSRTSQGEEPLDTSGGRVFIFDASSGLLATRWRLLRQSNSSALRSAFVV